MVQRRDILKTSLTLCGCAACGTLGVDGLGGADGPDTVSGTGYQLCFIGAQRETIMNRNLAAALDLNTLAGRTHLYWLDPPAELRGEVTIADGRPRARARSTRRHGERGSELRRRSSVLCLGRSSALDRNPESRRGPIV